MPFSLSFLTAILPSIHSFFLLWLLSFLPFLLPCLPSFLGFLPSFLPSLASFLGFFPWLSSLAFFLPSYLPSFLPTFFPSFLPSMLPSFLPLIPPHVLLVYFFLLHYLFSSHLCLLVFDWHLYLPSLSFYSLSYHILLASFLFRIVSCTSLLLYPLSLLSFPPLFSIYFLLIYILFSTLYISRLTSCFISLHLSFYSFFFSPLIFFNVLSILHLFALKVWDDKRSGRTPVASARVPVGVLPIIKKVSSISKYDL